ncbi:MAG TPA: thiamine phosphate synthase [Holophagaceae bacterium]|nr:thiamine phosphate synthase [Holophagaceae bacterium]
MFILGISPGQGLDPGRWRTALRSGIDAFLVREKQLEARALLDAVRFCRDTTPQVELWVAARLDVALAAGCGLHAPEAYPEVDPALVPLSRPLHDEAQWGDRRGCHQLLVAPVFDVPGKRGPWGAPRLHRFLDALPPVGPRILALGGVSVANAGSLRHPGLAGVALIRALWEGDPLGTVDTLRETWR